MISVLLEADYHLARPLIREIMQLGYEVVWSQHREDTQRLMKRETFDLVILALTPLDQPALDSLSTLREPGPAPLMVLLEGDRPAERDPAFPAGANASIVKPFRPRAFRKGVRTVLRQLSVRKDASGEPPLRRLAQART